MQTSFLGYSIIQTIGLLEEKITKAGQYTSLRYFIVFLQSSWGQNKELVKYIAVLGNIGGIYKQNSHSALNVRNLATCST
jgi:hypothetical protein